MMTPEFEALQTAIRQLTGKIDQRFDRLDDRLGRIERRLDKVDNRLGVIERAVVNIEDKLLAPGERVIHHA